MIGFSIKKINRENNAMKLQNVSNKEMN